MNNKDCFVKVWYNVKYQSMKLVRTKKIIMTNNNLTNYAIVDYFENNLLEILNKY